MQQLILVKQSRNIALAHLYEHIFCMHADQFLQSHGFFQFIDYHSRGFVYDSGIVLYDLEVYSPSITHLVKEIPFLTPKFDQKSVSTAATQLLAECEEPFVNTDTRDVTSALSALQSQPWQNIDELGIIDTKGTRRVSHPFYVAEGDSLPARRLVASIHIDPMFIEAHRQLLPLFRGLAGTILFNGEDVVIARSGYYSDDVVYKSTKQQTYRATIYKIAHGNEKKIVNLEADIIDYQKTVTSLRRHKAFERVVKSLQANSYSYNAVGSVGFDANFEDTGVLIGSKGWREIATMENVELLLKHMSIEVKFGRKKVSAPLVKD